MHEGAVAASTWEVRGRIARAAQAVGFVLLLLGWATAMLAREPGGPGGLVVFTIGWGMIALSWSFLGAFEKLALVRLIQDLPTSRIRSAPQGYVELHGTVGPGDESLRCPKCGTACLWFQYYGGNKNKQRFVPTGRAPDIVLDDGTGTCLVKAQGAELFAADGGGHVHICVGDPLYVLGEFRSGAAATRLPAAGSGPSPSEAGAGERAEQVRRRLLQIKYDKRRMAVYDVDRDGRLDPRELEAMRRVVERQVERAPAAPAPAAAPDSVIKEASSDADRLPLVIVVGDEHDAVRSARSEAWQRGVAAVVASLFVAAFLLAAPLS